MTLRLILRRIAGPRSLTRRVGCSVVCSALALVGLSGCPKPGAITTCDRSNFWLTNNGDLVMRDRYLDSLEEAFALDEDGRPTRGLLAYRRLWGLERFCFALRAE